MDTTGQSRIFISYSHRGNGPEWKAALLRGLHVFEQHHLLDVWQDGKIRVSSFWDDDIKQAMSKARLAVVLLTKEALESEYIVNQEFPFLRERQQSDKLPVFPVICEECDWRAHDWLRATQSPNESNPLAQLGAAAQESIFRKLATDIAEELSRVALAGMPKPDEPTPSDRIYLDKFPLTHSSGAREEKLIGREQELALLDLALAQPHTAIVSFVAWGGVGKTMLVQHWLQRLEREGWFGARRVYAWSFYSQGTTEDRQASEDTFLAHALEWFGVQCEPTLSPWDKGRLLGDAVAREPTLLILDGIEPLQYPPGPMGGQLRAPGVQSLLKQFARKATAEQSAIGNRQSEINNGLCLVTTREPLTNLADFERCPSAAWGSVLRVELGNLTEEAGAALLHHVGARRAGAAEIKADDTELLAASREVDGHALTLNLLGRLLARAHGGDVRRRDLVKFEEADRKEQGGTTFKMLAAFENWFARSGEFGARQLAVLRMLGLFDRPADAGCIGALRKPPVIAGLTDPLFITRLGANTGQAIMQPLLEEDWNTATAFLDDFCLIRIQHQADDNGQMLDCHPLVREYFKQVSDDIPENWRLAHHRIYEHLRDTTADKPQPTLEELQPLYQAVIHGCRAHRFSEALELVYWRRIQRREDWYAWKKIGAVGSEIQLFAAFFRDSWSQLQEHLPPPDASFILNQAGLMLRSEGRLEEAITLVLASLRLHSAHGMLKQAAAGSSNLSELHLLRGAIDEAIDSGVEGENIADRSRDLFQAVNDRTTLAAALFAAGRLSEADEKFSQSEAIQGLAQPQTPRLYALRGHRYGECLLSGPERGAWASHLSLDDLSLFSGWYVSTCVEVEKRAMYSLRLVTAEHWLLDAALDKLGLGRIGIYRVLLDEESSDKHREAVAAADLNLSGAVDALRIAGAVEYLPSGLQSRAWLRVLESDAAGAQADLDEAWDIAERGPMRLHLADIHLHRARLFFREKPYPWKSAQDDLAAAEKLINECGYHRRDEELDDAKRAILGP